ncbi:MAG TPA: DUF5652 family protein [Candidatus Levybacteria bacterium]|nr:DUF5652 family protein [Candidatus Levybacteria bacterium]
MPQIPFENPFLVFILLIWSIIWKGFGLWRASRQEQRNWFIAMLVVSTFGLLEIIYLFFFSRKKLTLKEMKSWIGK